MKNLTLKLAAAFAAALALSLAACSGDDEPSQDSVAVTGVSLSPTTMELTVGSPGKALTAEVQPAGATDKGVTWGSSPGGVVDIVGTGLAVTVNPLTVGVTTITVITKDKGETATCHVNVAAPVAVTSVTLAPTTLSLTLGGAGQSLTATVAPADATDKSVTWKSEPNGVVNIAGTGATVTVSPAAAGTAAITVTTADNNKTATCAVTVIDPSAAIDVTGVALSQATMSLIVGGANGALTATIEPADATNKNVTWASSNNAAATVAESGLTATVIALAAGTSNITVTTQDGSWTATCAVTVSAGSPPMGPGLFVATSAGLLKNGTLAVPNVYLTSVYVDAQNNVHAAGSGADGKGVYLLNGVAQALPGDTWATGARGKAMHVTDDGHVYIAGYQSSGAKTQAMLWRDGAAVPLAGSGGINSEANSVYVHGGDVYVVGYGPDSGMYGSQGLVWRNDEVFLWYQHNAPANSVAVTPDGTVYFGTEYVICSVDIDSFDGGDFDIQVIEAADCCFLTVVGGEVWALCNFGGYPIVFNGSDFHYLSMDPMAITTRGAGLCVADDGTEYVCGYDRWNASYTDIRPVLWTDGARQMLPNPSGATYANGVHARGVQ
jgi:uncharacterized protein YjdB